MSLKDHSETLKPILERCQSAFIDLRKIFEAGPSRVDIAESFRIQNDEFNEWVVNLGLFEDDNASFDSRFGNAPNAYEYARRVLHDLEEQLNLLSKKTSSLAPNEQSHDSASDSMPSQEQLELSHQDNTEDVTSGASEDKSLDLVKDISTTALLLENVSSAIDRLFWLSSQIKKLSQRKGDSEAYQIDPEKEDIRSERDAEVPDEGSVQTYGKAQGEREPSSEKNIRKQPITFKDSVGRTFSFPWSICRTWEGMETLIKEAYLPDEYLSEYIQNGNYELLNSNNEIILPFAWEHLVYPGAKITMRTWGVPEKDVKKALLPVYPRILIPHIEVETLQFYNLEWDFYEDDLDYVVIFKEMSVSETDELFAHTAKLRKKKMYQSRIDRRRTLTRIPTEMSEEFEREWEKVAEEPQEPKSGTA